MVTDTVTDDVVPAELVVDEADPDTADPDTADPDTAVDTDGAGGGATALDPHEPGDGAKP